MFKPYQVWRGLKLVCSAEHQVFFRNYATGLSYFHNPGSEPLQAITVGQLINRTSEVFGSRVAISSLYEGLSLTYEDLRLESDRLAAGLLKLGLKTGDRVGIFAPNSAHWAVIMFACAKAGLISVFLNPAYRKSEVEYCVKKVDMRAIFTDEAFKTQDYHQIIKSMAPEISSSSPGSEFRSKNVPSLTHLIMYTDKHLPGTIRYSDLLESDISGVNDLERQIQPDAPCNIQFSSGTTGAPKAATLTHFNTVNNSYFFSKRLHYHNKPHKICLHVPMFHIFGSVLGILSSVHHGITLMLPSPSFKAKSTIDALKIENCSIMYGTPTMYIDMCDMISQQIDTDVDLQRAMKSFDVVLSAGSLCTPELFRRISGTFNCTNIVSAYGMTEAGPLVTTSKHNDTFEQRTDTVGYVSDHAEVKVVDQDGNLLPFGTPGEVWYRSYGTMLGYWNDPVKTSEVITPCRWLKSGDLFVLHENGYGKVVGRIKDVIIRGGENIFPREIEEFLQTHPDILEVEVHAVNDERLGEEVAASIRLKNGKCVNEESIKEFCKGKIAHFKIPRYVQVVDDFPKTASGKVQKYLLRQMLEDKLFGKK